MAVSTDFETIWNDLLPIGRASDGGYRRQTFGTAEREAGAWFLEQADALGLVVEADGNGNRIAWWLPEGGTAYEGVTDAVLTGSHLDSVVRGGGFDGALGVASALAAVGRLIADGHRPVRAVGVAAFVEEEGSVFNVTCLGTRLATGQLTAAKATELRSADGTALPDVMAAGGVEPALGPAAWPARIGTALELHVEQGRTLDPAGLPLGWATAIWPHGRYRLDLTGQGDHAGASRVSDRHDPMQTYAMTALAANKHARTIGDEVARATFGRLDVTPNQTNAVPYAVTAWMDARAADDETLARLVGAVERSANERAERDGTSATLTPESLVDGVDFDVALTTRLDAVVGGALGAGKHPVIPSFAGHDAGILAGAGIPTAMLFVRNPTGISHAPEESAGMADCLTGVEALTAALRDLTS